MSSRELDRLQMLVRVSEGRISQAEAARVLGLSPRQLRRIWSAYKAHGAAALASRQRGRPSNRRLAHELRELALALVRDRYSDFGPTFAHEKLTEVHGLELSVSTLRTWMTEDGLWVPRAQRDRRVHQPRRRRECLGELVQIDGSDHRWFEERAPKCTLLVFIDDATGRLMTLHFCESESTFSYFAAAEKYVARHGKPVAFYSDKASVFRVNAKAPKGGDGWTQFGRAMHDLNVDTMCANTPQAKGRVERANLTLQRDRTATRSVQRDRSNAIGPNAIGPRHSPVRRALKVSERGPTRSVPGTRLCNAIGNAIGPRHSPSYAIGPRHSPVRRALKVSERGP